MKWPFLNPRTTNHEPNTDHRTQNLISIRPPEYFPRPVYFALLDAADRFVLADTFQYSRQSFQNRALIRTPDGGHWITIPLKGSQHGVSIAETAIRRVPYWNRRHWRSLHYNYRTAPFFDFYEPELKWIFERDWTRLGALTCATVEVICGLLGIGTALERSTDMRGRPSELRKILEAEQRDDLLSPMEAAKFDAEAVAPSAVLEVRALEYRQNFEGFVPGMSILDLLFNYGPDTLTMIRRSAVVTMLKRSS
jgi:hypothetical protein